MADEGRYLAYLVRLWAVQRNGDVLWRASVENAHTGERRTFASVAGLIDFLQDLVGEEMALPEELESSHRGV